MQTVISKLGLFPEWGNFIEANTNFVKSEDTFVKSLIPLSGFDESELKTIKIRDLSTMTQPVHEISETMDNSNQAISYVHADLKNLESTYNKFQPKKLNKLKYDASFKRSMKKSDDLHEMFQSGQVNFFDDNDDEAECAEELTKQQKYDKEFDDYQKDFIQSMANIFSEIAISRSKAAAKIGEIGKGLRNKPFSIEIIQRQTDEDVINEMKKLKKTIKKAEKLPEEKVSVDENDDDDFVLVKDEGFNSSPSEDEYEDDDEFEILTHKSIHPQVAQKPQVTDPTLEELAALLFEDENGGNENKPANNDEIEIKAMATHILEPNETPKATTASPPKQTKRRNRRGKRKH